MIIGLPDGSSRAATAQEIAEYQAGLPSAPSRAQWETSARLRAAKQLNGASEAVMRMISSRDPANLDLPAIRALLTTFSTLASTLNLSASIDEASAYALIDAAQKSAAVAISPALRAEYALIYKSVSAGR